MNIERINILFHIELKGGFSRLYTDYIWWPYDNRVECGPNFLTFVLRLRENPEKPQQGKLSDRGSNPDPLRERQRCYPLTTAVVRFYCDNILRQWITKPNLSTQTVRNSNDSLSKK